MADVISWWLSAQLLGALALPLTVWFFRRLPDRGYSFARPLGLLLSGYGAWMLAMLGLGSFGRGLLVLVGLLLALGGVALLGRAGLRRALDELRSKLPWLVLVEVLFTLGLFAGVWMRWHDIFGRGAALIHTEQPMDLTFISGILASSQFPPQDPWLAPYPINYYYLGYLLVAALIRLSGVDLGTGFTLGIATIWAFAATGTAGLIYNMMGLVGEQARGAGVSSDPHSAAIAGRASSASLRTLKLARYLVPLLGVVLVLLIGNQSATLQILAGSEKVVALGASETLAAVLNGLGSRQALVLPTGLPSDLSGNETHLIPWPDGTNRGAVAWWSSRAVWDTITQADGTSVRAYAITEFPLFSFLLGDLHPHVLSLPWSLLAMCVALNVLARRAAPELRARGGWVDILITGIVLGGLYAINSWDLPTYMLIYLGAMALLYLRLAPSPRGFFWPHFLQQAAAVVIASYLLYLPFHMSFAAPTADPPIGIAQTHTSLWHFMVMFGLFAVPLVAFVLREIRSSKQLPYVRYIPLGLAFLLLAGVLVGWPLFVLLPLALLAVWQAYQRREQPGIAFTLWLFAVGALVVWGCDVVYLRDNYGSPRMNTIFKFYYQVWLIWGTAAAFALWRLLQQLRPASLLWLAPTSLLLVSALSYALVAPARPAPSREIDGLAYLSREAPDEAAAVEWVRDNTPANAVIAMAPGQPYNSSTSRVASATGRPTIIGWTQHEGLWRGGQPELAAQISEREQDLKSLYTSTDSAAAQQTLGKYGARYVYVGPAERNLAAESGAPPEALAKFDQFMSRVFEQGDVVLYQLR